MSPANRSEPDVVLIVDDVPESLCLLSDAFDETGHMVLVATDGPSALDRLRVVRPDVILLDAVMPGWDGFETCRRIKQTEAGHEIPVIFMTGLSDTEHVVRGFAAGGTDYVTKPIQPEEVLARVAAHIRNARLLRHAQRAIDAVGLAMIVLDADRAPAWLTPQARAWLHADDGTSLPAALLAWLSRLTPGSAPEPLVFEHHGAMFVARHLGETHGDQTLVLLERRKTRDAQTAVALNVLTQREAEVLTWVARGKTNKDIADILGMSPRTVNKHLEHIYVKLGVETRTAAAGFLANTAPLPTY